MARARCGRVLKVARGCHGDDNRELGGGGGSILRKRGPVLWREEMKGMEKKGSGACVVCVCCAGAYVVVAWIVCG